MNVVYDPQVDVLRIVLNTSAIDERDDEKPGIILDASMRAENPLALEYAVAD